MTRSLSDYFLKNDGIELNILITSDYWRCTKRFFFLLCGEVTRHSVSHSATSKPVLQAPTPKQKSNRFFSIVYCEYALHNRLVIAHKPVKAPTYTCALPNI